MNQIINLILGGTIGTLSRYFLSGLVYRAFGTTFPYGTFAVNILGCFLVGLFASIMDEKIVLNSNLRLLFMVGFCGAFTTFSTLIYESYNLIKDGDSLKAFLNIVISVIIGFIVFKLGINLGKII